MLPKHVRYQTALHPEGFFIGARHNRRMLLYAKPGSLSIAFLKKLQVFFKVFEMMLYECEKPEWGKVWTSYVIFQRSTRVPPPGESPPRSRGFCDDVGSETEA